MTTVWHVAFLVDMAAVVFLLGNVVWNLARRREPNWRVLWGAMIVAWACWGIILLSRPG